MIVIRYNGDHGLKNSNYPPSPSSIFIPSYPSPPVSAIFDLNDLISIFMWDETAAIIQGVDEATIGLLDEHRLSPEELGQRYCTQLDPDRPDHSPGMEPDRASNVCTERPVYSRI